MVDSSFYAGIFVEAGAKPNIVSNIFHGGDSGTLKSSLTQVFTYNCVGVAVDIYLVMRHDFMI